jgi:hypothetical protein
MIESLFTRLAVSRRTLDPNEVRFGLRHLAFAAAILALTLCARAGIPLDSLHGPLCGMIDPDSKTQIAISPVFTRANVVVTDSIKQSGGQAALLLQERPNILMQRIASEAPRTLMLFGLAVRGSLLILDWKDGAEAEAIRIYDLHGSLLFTWRPVPGAGLIGRWVWDGRDAKGTRLGSGRYLISVQTRSGTRNQVFVWGRDH